jgi:putative inorganic carbon (hco3(-)) transporter
MLGDLARALSQGVLIFMAGAAFVGIAFQPLQDDLFALAVSASAALRQRRPGCSWRQHAARS